MKQVIDGKTYNTETAIEIENWCSSGFAKGDFRYCDESLYITKKGRFFLAGEGGAMTRWCKPCGNNGWTGGSGIQALSKEEALAWCEQREIEVNVIEQFFDVEEA